MQEYEVDAVLTGYRNKYKNDWERTRFIGYCTVKGYTNKIKTPTDLIKFEWEKESSEDSTDAINWNEIEAMRNKLKQQRNG